MRRAAIDPRFDVELIGVSKRYGAATAVDDISLRIPKASHCCMLGPSGCGKTSTPRMIAGHESVSGGDVLIDGVNVAGMPPLQPGTAMVFQNYALFPHLSYLGNVAFSLRMRGVRTAERAQRAREFLALVHMDGFANRLPGQLAGGQQQRVALARALVGQPRVLDEPLSALDPFLRARVREELKRLQRELGITFTHATHSQDEAMALADMMVVMQNGHIRQTGAPREVFGHPVRSFVARFIGGHNVLPEASGSVAVQADRCRLAGGWRRRTAQVEAVEYQGGTVRIALTTEAGEAASVLLPDDVYDADPLQAGVKTRLVWSASDERRLDHPPLRWTRVTAYAAAASCSLLIGVM